MRRDLVVTYDISDPKRLRQVFQTMKGYGEHVQYSVFRCTLTAMLKTRMMRDLLKIIHQIDDQVLIFDLGPADSDKRRVEWVGRPYTRGERGPTLL